MKIEVETAYAERKPAGPLKVTMKVNGKDVAEGKVPVSAPLLFTANDCLDIGIDLGSPVSLDYYDNAPFKFNGKIEKVRAWNTSVRPHRCKRRNWKRTVRSRPRTNRTLKA